MRFSRAYSGWFFLPAEAVGGGEHELLVTLHADDHIVWAVGGEPVAATATLGGTDHTTTAAPTSPPAGAEVFEIVDGRASPPLERVNVERGATVWIAVTSDQPDEIHLHDYDLTARLRRRRRE